MRIALLALGRRGAPPRYAFMMARALARYADVLCVVAAGAENLDCWKAEAQANDRFQIVIHATYGSKSEFALHTLQWWRYDGIADDIRRFRPDVVYSPFCHYWEKAIYSRLKDIPSVGTVHDVLLHRGEDSFFERVIDKVLKKRNFDRYVVLTEAGRGGLLRRGIPYDIIATVPHAAFSSTSAACPIKSPCNKILFFGRVVDYKGLDVLLDAMPAIHSALPDLKLVIAGQGDYSPYIDSIQRQSAYIELNDCWIEPDKIDGYFLDSDLVVLPYVEASQSGIIPLAQSLGRPVVASAIGGLPEQVSHGSTGLLVPPSDSEALAGAIVEAYSSPGCLTDMSRECIRFSKENSWDKSARTLVDFIKIYETDK